MTITDNPFTLNVLYKSPCEIATHTFATARAAIRVAREEVKWRHTVHATVTDERTGKELFDEAGEQI